MNQTYEVNGASKFSWKIYENTCWRFKILSYRLINLGHCNWDKLEKQHAFFLAGLCKYTLKNNALGNFITKREAIETLLAEKIGYQILQAALFYNFFSELNSSIDLFLLKLLPAFDLFV